MLTGRSTSPAILFLVRGASLTMSYLAVAAVFAKIPLVSDGAFWILGGAYLVWFVAHRPRKWSPLMRLSVGLLLGAMLLVPFAGDSSFWILLAGYLAMFGDTHGAAKVA